MAKVCAKCGAQLSDKAKFCIKCGTAVKTPPPAQKAPPPPKKGRSKNILFVIIIVAIAVATVLMLGNLQGGREEPVAEEPPPAITYEEPEEEPEVIEEPPVIEPEPEPEPEDEFEYIEGMTAEEPTVFDFAVLPERDFPRGMWSVNQIISAYGTPEDITADYLTGYELVFVRVYYADIYIYFSPESLESFSFSGEVFESGMYTLNESDKDIELDIRSLLVFDAAIKLPNDIRIGQSTKEQVVSAYREFPAYIFQSDEYDTNMIIYDYAFFDENEDMALEDEEFTGGITYLFDAEDVLRSVTIEWTFFDL